MDLHLLSVDIEEREVKKKIERERATEEEGANGIRSEGGTAKDKCFE